MGKSLPSCTACLQTTRLQTLENSDRAILVVNWAALFSKVVWAFIAEDAETITASEAERQTKRLDFDLGDFLAQQMVQ